MVVVKTQEIRGIEDLKFKGKYYEALEKIENLLKNKEASEIEKIQAKIEKSYILYFLGLFEYLREKKEEALRISKEALSESEKLGETALIFDSLFMKTSCLFQLGKNKEFVEGVSKLEEIYLTLEKEDFKDLDEKYAHLSVLTSVVGFAKALYVENYKTDYNKDIDILEEGVKRAKKAENKEILILLLITIDQWYNMLGNYDIAIEYGNKALVIAKELNNEYMIGQILSQIGWDHWGKGEYDTQLEYSKKSLEIRKNTGNHRFSAKGYSDVGVFYGMTGEWKESKDYFQKAHDILTEDGKREDEPGFLNNLAASYNLLGEVDKALELFERLYEILKKKKYEYGSYLVLSNIAGILFNKGKIDQSLKLYEQVLESYSRVGEKFRIAITHKLISRIYEKKGAFNNSFEHLEKALKIQLELGNKDFIAGTFYEFILLTTKNDKIDLAKEYYNKLEELTEEIEPKSTKRLILVAEGIILMKSKESRDRDRAEVLFDQLLQEDLDPYLTMEILLQSSELLLAELKETSNERYLTKLQKNISKLIEIGTKSNFSHVIVESLWFKSQLSLLDLNVDKARELLTQALDIAERKGLNRLALKITNAKEQLIKQKIELDELEKTSPTISKRMEIIKVENGFKELKQKEVFEFSIEKVESSGKLLSLKI